MKFQYYLDAHPDLMIVRGTVRSKLLKHAVLIACAQKPGKFSCYHWLLRLCIVWQQNCPSIYNQNCSFSTNYVIQGLYSKVLAENILIFAWPLPPKRGNWCTMQNSAYVWWNEHAAMLYKISKADDSKKICQVWWARSHICLLYKVSSVWGKTNLLFH